MCIIGARVLKLKYRGEVKFWEVKKRFLRILSGYRINGVESYSLSFEIGMEFYRFVTVISFSYGETFLYLTFHGVKKKKSMR